MPARRGSAWTIAAGLAVVYVLSTLPTPLYVLYQKEFGFSQLTLTLVYAAYVIGSILTMFFFGRLADQIGRRPVVLAALVLTAVAAGLFLLAKDTAWLCAARIVTGLAVALASGAATAWILDLEPSQDEGRATRIALGANEAGLALGPLITGLLAQRAPLPLRLTYWVFLALLVPAAILMLRTRETGERKPLREVSLKPRLGVPREMRRKFVAPALGAFATMAVVGFYIALIPTLLSKELHRESHALAGFVVALLFACGTATMAVKPGLDAGRGLSAALALLVPSAAMLLGAEAVRSLALLVGATVVAGAATGLGFRCSLQIVNGIAPKDDRSEVISTYLIACYCGVSLPVIGIGLLGQVAAPLLANAVFAGVICAVAGAALVVEARAS